MPKFCQPDVDRSPRRPGRFSILHLLILTAAAGTLLAIHQRSPHVAILMSTVLAAWWTSWAWLRWRDRPCPRSLRAITLFSMLFAWACLYVASIGPVGILVQDLDEREGLITIYAPVGWLHANTPLREPLEAYTQRWWK